MKKLLSMIVLVVLSVQVATADDIITKDTAQLPLAAREFITTHFPNPKISYVKIENELFESTKYEAVLTNGTEIEFNSKGVWKEVDAKHQEVPSSIVPDYAKQYVQENFPSNIIKKVERERYGLKVELNNGLDLKFNSNGRLIKIDD